MTDLTVSYNGNAILTANASLSKKLNTSGRYCEDDITIEYTRPTFSTQTKSVTPTESAQTVTPDSGYDGLSQVTVNAMPSGTAGTPTATKGTVSNHSVSVTPSVTNTTGYITGGTKTGTAVTVSASELVSGTKTISASGTTDVTNYASASVAAGSATVTSFGLALTPTINVDSDGLITAQVSKVQSVTPTVSEGYVASGRTGYITITGSNTRQLTVYSGAHHAVVSLISFLIEQTTYQAEEGMTWTQWCASSYNTDAFYVDAQYVMSSDDKTVFNATPDPLSPSDIINAINYILI